MIDGRDKNQSAGVAAEIGAMPVFMERDWVCGEFMFIIYRCGYSVHHSFKLNVFIPFIFANILRDNTSWDAWLKFPKGKRQNYRFMSDNEVKYFELFGLTFPVRKKLLIKLIIREE